MDRAVVHAEMLSIRDRIGKEKFPVIDMKCSCKFFFSSSQVLDHANGYTGTSVRELKVPFPIVIKVSNADAGFGKIVVRSQSEYDDVESILALSNYYFTEEPFVSVVTSCYFSRSGRT